MVNDLLSKPNIEISTNTNRGSSARIFAAGLEPYNGPWDIDQAAHLLRRTLFGAKRGQIETIASGNLNQALNMLLEDQPLPDPPVVFREEDPLPIGTTFINEPVNFDVEFQRIQSLKSWWVGLLLEQGISIREKMTMFWHNHFVVATQAISDSRYLYKHHTLLRENATGNFRTLVQEITVDPSMLVYLNGNQNSKFAPNENYARELLELFTIGKGPTIAAGNYTHYSEQDVLAAAKVLTGWHTDRDNISSFFEPNLHDVDDKTFSESFNNTVISDNGENEYLDLIDMIFAQAETARFICRKLYRWFVYYKIDDETESQIIEPLAQELLDNNFEVKPVLRTLLGSAHFFEEAVKGAMIKNPVDFVIGYYRQFEIEFPTDLVTLYKHRIYYGIWVTQQQQMDLGDPPNVAGWTAYYQEPQYYKIWANSVTIPMRAEFTDIMTLFGREAEGFRIELDPIPLVEATSDPFNPNTLIDELTHLLLPLPLTQNQKDFLKESLIPGLPDFEWTIEWGTYVDDPSDPCKINAVNVKLKALIKAITSMAEYQLS